jgi:NAD(P)-dependent dehydrogenase (short-subunit alcohol dehydrogenase family)
MAVRLAQEGAQVWAVDFDPSRLAQTLALAGEHAQAIHPFECDVTDSASVKRMVQACADRLGGLDILINNVGGSAPGGPVEMSEDIWDAQINFNLKSVFLTCKHALPWLKARGGGAIVNMASTSGIRWTGSAQVAYAAAKAGVIQMSKVMAIQHAGTTSGSTPWCRASCTPPWSSLGWQASVRVVMCKRC